jgi:hypothetical protein
VYKAFQKERRVKIVKGVSCAQRWPLAKLGEVRHMKGISSYTPEQKKALCLQVEEIAKTENTTLAAACRKAGISYWSYYNWQDRRGEKGKGKRRKRKKPVLVSHVVPVVEAERLGTERLGAVAEPEAYEVGAGLRTQEREELGRIVGIAVGSALKSFYQGRN